MTYSFRWKMPIIKKWGDAYYKCPVRLRSGPRRDIVWRKGGRLAPKNIAYATPMEFLVAHADAGEQMYMDILNTLITARLGVDR